jgi:integrase
VSARRRTNGEGTIYRRKDGRWEAAVYADTNVGTRKRIRIYGRTREDAHRKLVEQQTKANQGIPAPEHSWRLDEYLDRWLEEVVRRIRRPATYALYEMTCRLYLKPGLGKYRLPQLSVPIVQAFMNRRLEGGDSVRKVQVMRTVLSSALSRAMREELLNRNVAQLVTLPEWRRREVGFWSADEARQFLKTTRRHQLYPAFLLLLTYGLRRGEVLGLRWCDLDFDDNTIRIRQQIQRVGRGELLIGPTKTRMGQRDLPMVSEVRGVLADFRVQQGTAASHDQGLVFTTATRHAIEPRNFVRTYDYLCRAAGVRRIRVHDLRRTVASLLNKLHVPARDAQLILGHSSVTVTQEIYTEVDRESKAEALGRIQELFIADR